MVDSDGDRVPPIRLRLCVGRRSLNLMLARIGKRTLMVALVRYGMRHGSDRSMLSAVVSG